MASKHERIDVAGIMRQIRADTRARNEEIVRRLERAHKQMEEQLPRLSDVELRRRIERLSELFGLYCERMSQYVAVQEPSHINIQPVLAEICRVGEDLWSLPPSPGGRWSLRHLIKKTLVPLRRFIMRRQFELNRLVRDTLLYLVSHSAHVETQRMQLDMTALTVETLRLAVERLEAEQRFRREWARASMLDIADYIGKLDTGISERHAEAMTNTQQALRKEIAHLNEQWGARLTEVASRMPDAAPARSAALTGFDYMGFSSSLRGKPDVIRQQQARYVEILRGQNNVLDAGCGRGELLELLRESGIAAYGVDLDENMVRCCREKGLDARCEDVLEHLAALPDGSLGGIVALQLIEHLDFTNLLLLLRLSALKLRSEGVIILETVNPTCLATFSGAFYADPTHLRPIHPEASRLLLENVGFGNVCIEFLSPVPDGEKLAPLALDSQVEPGLRRVVELINENINRLNSILYNYGD
ncbi:methyltransferase domain-containing protein, partial [Candidatus Sumerlaeota bacterium]|nr:methyltransferase domain-containing protein [Candidatus Sumerlaeota bacterium]